MDLLEILFIFTACFVVLMGSTYRTNVFVANTLIVVGVLSLIICGYYLFGGAVHV